MNENNKENLVLFIEDDQFDMNERLYDSIDEYAAETGLNITKLWVTSVDDAVEIIVEKVLKNSPRPKPLLIRLDGNLRNSYGTEFIKKILEYGMSPEYSDIVKGILQVTYGFTADSSYFKKMLDFEGITEEQFSREKVRDKPIGFFSNPLFKLLNEETGFNI